ncbi:DUF302 domain-containing protein [Seohaeicola zhoushanensis]|uniref:DUF302 domain-containing protein n=1 Tax=Seohaeicola zhoushanensis TaxID=1569283 RepID=A0A8J3M301_9RHOB|nr:DUF302 domain-containing protein [Seohaeicola zhoushanensis]GHF32683.1 hypothetical protein GCM10017056_00050 [Seohaeicola zhoushanensis]
MKHVFLAATFALAAQAAAAQQAVTYKTEAAFDDVIFELENAITDAGLVVDWVSHVGEMLERTRQDVGSDKVIFERADVYNFCSAIVSRNVMEADPMNIAFCPYGIFVAKVAGDETHTIVGYRSFPEGAMQEAAALVDGLARKAAGLE